MSFTQELYSRNKDKIMSFLADKLNESKHDFACLHSYEILKVIFNGNEKALMFISSDLFQLKTIGFRFDYALSLKKYTAMYEFGKAFNIGGYEGFINGNPNDLLESKNKAREFVDSVDFPLFIDLIIKDLPKYGLSFNSKLMPTIRKKKKFLWFFN